MTSAHLLTLLPPLQLVSPSESARILARTSRSLSRGPSGVSSSSTSGACSSSGSSSLPTTPVSLTPPRLRRVPLHLPLSSPSPLQAVSRLQSVLEIRYWVGTDARLPPVKVLPSIINAALLLFVTSAASSDLYSESSPLPRENRFSDPISFVQLDPVLSTYVLSLLLLSLR